VVFGAGKLAAFFVYCKEYLTKRLGLNLAVKLPYTRGTNAMVIGHDHDPELAVQDPDALPHGRVELHTMRTAEQVVMHTIYPK
jgi:hypothetical protein